MTRFPVTKVLTAAAITLILLLVWGCSLADKESEDMNQAFEALMKRPNLSQVDADYQSMFKTIRERLVAEVGVAQWVPDDEPMSGSSCGGGISNLEGAEVRRYDAGMSPGNLPDAAWDRAVAIVTDVAGHYGFGAPRVIVSGPSDHEVSFRNTYNGELLFGTGANTILGGSTGCHLTQAAHLRGIPAPPRKY
ncbi:MAG: LppA family lipoprotein [Actinomycetota bacterium]